MSIANPKRTIYENLSGIARALGHAHRLELLEWMGQGPRSVESLSRVAGLTVANTSRHLQLLRRARLVEADRQGKQVFYRLAGDAAILAVLKALGTLGERNSAEIQRIQHDYFRQRDALEPVTRRELLARIKAGEVTVLDVRSEEEFAGGHLPGAVNIPIKQLSRRLSELPRQQEIVAYCRGPYCAISFEAVAALRERGYRIRRLEDGFPEWKAAGFRVVEGMA